MTTKIFIPVSARCKQRHFSRRRHRMRPAARSCPIKIFGKWMRFNRKKLDKDGAHLMLRKWPAFKSPPLLDYSIASLQPSSSHGHFGRFLNRDFSNDFLATQMRCQLIFHVTNSHTPCCKCVSISLFECRNDVRTSFSPEKSLAFKTHLATFSCAHSSLHK